MKLNRIVVSLCALCLAVPAALTAGTYYVSPQGNDSTGNGSAQRPWATITKAVNTIPDDGSTVVVRDGTYNGSFGIKRKFTLPVLIRAENPYRAVLRSTSVVLVIWDAVNVQLSGFDVARPRSTSSALLVHIARSKNITLHNNFFHESYKNDLLKINESSRNIAVIGNIFRNQEGTAGQHIDINGCTDVLVRENIFFNDAAAGGLSSVNETHGYIVVKNSGSAPESRRTRIVSNVFLNWQGNNGSNFVLLGEDGKPHYEVQEVVVENNLMLGNSSVVMRSPIGVKGARDSLFRNNTISGNLPSNAFGMRINREGANPLNSDIGFVNNVWSDPTGTMTDFSDGYPNESTDLTLRNNAYWNGGKPIPTDGDVLNYTMDPQAVVADPKLPAQGGIVLPNWLGTRFASGNTTIRQEFERLVRAYGIPGAGSSLIGRSEAGQTPESDILDAPRGQTPDLGAVQSNGQAPGVRLVLFRNRLMGGEMLPLNQVMLPVPAAAGAAIQLSSSNPALAAVPSSIGLNGGESAVQFAISTATVAAPTPVTITASYGGENHSSTLLLVPQGVVSVNATNIKPFTGPSEHLVMLEGPVSVPTPVYITSSRPDLVSFPTPAIAQPGESFARFQLNCAPITEPTSITFSASLTNPGTASAAGIASDTITFQPGLAILSVVSDPPTLIGAGTLQITATISEPAPKSGTVLKITTDKPSVATVPASVTVPEGAYSITFPVPVKNVGAPVSVAIRVTPASGGATVTAWPRLDGIYPAGIYMPSSAAGGSGINVVVQMKYPVPEGGGQLVIGSSRPDILFVPAPIALKAGDQRITFSLKSVPVTANVGVVFSVSYDGYGKTKPITITPPQVAAIYPGARTITGGKSVSNNAVITSTPAGPNTSIALKSSNPTVLQVPASISMTAGSNRAYFPITTNAVKSNVTVTVSATSGGVTKSVAITVVP